MASPGVTIPTKLPKLLHLFGKPCAVPMIAGFELLGSLEGCPGFPGAGEPGARGSSVGWPLVPKAAAGGWG